MKMDKGSCQISATVFTLANSYGSYLAVFSKNPLNIFHVSILNTVCLKKSSFIRVIADCDYVNLRIFLYYIRVTPLLTSYIMHIY